MNPDVELYKELVKFCNANKAAIETKFDRKVEFTDFNEQCFLEMYVNIKNEPNPIAPLLLKQRVEGLKDLYLKMGFRFLAKRNNMTKGLDVQLGQWYEKAFRMFLATKGIAAQKKGFPFPDFQVGVEKVKAYYELKYIEAPFINANHVVKNTYPYTTSRYDYECSLTLDTGKKLLNQREKIELDLSNGETPCFYIWWFDAPHLKGIFYMNSKEVFDYWDNVDTLHIREARKGDELDHQERGKIYPPLLKMNSLSSLILELKFPKHA